MNWQDLTTTELIIEIIVGVTATISMLFIGIFIGRNYGTWEAFISETFKNLENKLKQ